MNQRQIAITLHDANLSMRQGLIESRLLMCVIGVLTFAAFPLWVAVLVDFAVAFVVIAVAEVMATRWMRRHGLEWKEPNE